MDTAPQHTVLDHPPSRRSRRAAGEIAPPGARDAARAGVSYYGRPAVKPSPFGRTVAAYISIAGLSGAAQVIASAADLFGPPEARPVVRSGRYIALAGTVVGPVLLIYDLHTPQRFYNMLRIFRRTSPMSIGTYVLLAFSGFSGLTAVAQWLADRDGSGAAVQFARVAQIPAALAGAGMTSYTAALLAATSNPFWAAAPRPLAVEFASSATAAGAAALSLATRGDDAGGSGRALATVAMLATGVEFVASLAAARHRRERGADAGERPAVRAGKQIARVLGTAVPIALYALDSSRRAGAPPGRLSLAASLAILARDLLVRNETLQTGNKAASRPEAYLRFTQAGASGAEARSAARPR